MFSTNNVDLGLASSAAACRTQTSVSIYTSRANVASVQVNDIFYTNSGLSNIFNGGLKWYGVTNVSGDYPQLDNGSGFGYSFLINSTGAVDAIVDCSVIPTPSPVPTAAPTQDVEIRQCGTTTPTYKVRISGTSGYINSQSIEITGAAAGPNPEFTGATCWEIIDSAATTYDSTVTVNSAYSSCGGCAPTPIYDLSLIHI